MAPDDPSEVQDAGAGAGADPDPSTQRSRASATGSGPEPGASRSDTALASSNLVHDDSAAASRASSKASSPASPSTTPAAPVIATSTPEKAAHARTQSTEDSGAIGLPSPASASVEVQGPADETVDVHSVAKPSPSVSDSPATVAASASGQPSEPQQNGDSKASETDADMHSYRPALTAAHGLPGSYSNAAPAVAAVEMAASASPVTSTYAASGVTTTQYASYPADHAILMPGDGYRPGAVPSNSSMSLPSMRTIDAMSHQRVSPPHTPHHSVPMSMNASLAAAGGPSYHTSQHTMPVPSSYAPSDSLARYPLPHDSRVLGSRGPKKEIKRRTKTGCLTCRKRRIKCDETHPICNNCKKSRRDCLGYDPIFRIRPQNPGGHSNSQIQPAPTSQSASIPSAATLHSTGGPGHSTASSYGSQTSMFAGSLSTTPPPSTLPSSSTIHTSASSYTSPVASSIAPPIKTDPGYEFAAPLESLHRLAPGSTSQDQIRSPDYQTSSIAVSNLPSGSKRMKKIHEIIDLLGPPPPPQQVSHTEETFNEITKVYHEMYAPGLSAFMETTWYYFVENGKMSFPRDANLIEHMATFLKILEAVKANDHSQMAYSGVLETRIVWELACTAYHTPDRPPQAIRVAMPPDGDPMEAKNRLRVVETLLCGEYLPVNPLALPLSDVDVHRTRQFDFWYSLAEFVRRRDSPDSPPAVKAREDALARMRHLLDGRENRDVLYSIAVVRELAPTYGPSYGANPPHLDETDPKNRLIVASKFILDEAQVTGGTTNVVRRFSDIASRAFVNPAVNVMRRAI